MKTSIRGTCGVKTWLRCQIFTTILGVFTFGLFGIACSTSQEGNQNFVLFMSVTGVLPIYTGEEISPEPVYKAFQFASTLVDLYSDLNDSVTVSTYSDSKCTKASAGTLSLSNNPASFEQGTATLKKMSYQLSSTLEELIYYKGTLANSGVVLCSLAQPVIQHFVRGQGYLFSGVPNAAGTVAATGYTNLGLVHRIDSSGRIVVAGVSLNASNGQEVSLWRILPTGALDTTFGTSGFAHTGTTGAAGTTGASELDSVADIQIDFSGNIILVGTSVNAAGGTELALWKYDSTGVLVTGFGTSGVYHSGSPGITGVVAAVSVRDFPYSMAIDSSSNIVVTGKSRNGSNNYELFVSRYTSAGVLDTTFASNGIYHSIGAAGGLEDIGNSIQIDSSGRYVIAGSSVYSGTRTELAIWRTTPTGALDTTFKSTGIVLYGVLGAALGTGANLADAGQSLKLDQEGNYIIAGTSKNASSGIELALWKYTSSGSLDSTFGSGGVVHSGSSTGAAGATGSNLLDSAKSLAIDQKYERYLIAGTSINSGGGQQLAVWVYKSDGTLDTNFNLTGMTTSPTTGMGGDMTAATVLDSARSIQVDSMGTYTVVGSVKASNGDFKLAVLRYLNFGILDY